MRLLMPSLESFEISSDISVRRIFPNYILVIEPPFDSWLNYAKIGGKIKVSWCKMCEMALRIEFFFRFRILIISNPRQYWIINFLK